MKDTYTKAELITFIKKFGNFVDDLYRPYTRDNFEASHNVNDWIDENINGIKENSSNKLTIMEFICQVQDGTLTDSDGFGFPVINGVEDKTSKIYPSGFLLIPSKTTHIIWYNN